MKSATCCNFEHIIEMQPEVVSFRDCGLYDSEILEFDETVDTITPYYAFFSSARLMDGKPDIVTKEQAKEQDKD